MLEKIPDGLSEIIDVFGQLIDIKRHLVTFPLPYPMLYGTNAVRRATCHRMAEDHFIAALEAIKAQGLEAKCLRYGGIYNYRAKRGGSSQPSTHAWGIAIDIEPEFYTLGSDKRFPQDVIDIFAAAGFFYGGDFDGRKDPMHFQLCTGY